MQFESEKIILLGMTTIIDNRIVSALLLREEKTMSWVETHLVKPVALRWPCLLSYLGEDSLFSSLPSFEQDQPLFQACVATLCANEEKDIVCYVYDRLFTEILTQIKALPQINADFLLKAIKEKRKSGFPHDLKVIFDPSLEFYEKALLEHLSETMHDLILYLGWDRMCVQVARLFNHQSTNSCFLKGMEIFKECLIESYHHIAEQKKTSPSLYRLVESLFFYQMREERLQVHTDAEWALLQKSFPHLTEELKFADAFYIDDVWVQNDQDEYLIKDSSERVELRSALAGYIVNKFEIDKMMRLNFNDGLENILKKGNVF